MSTINRNSGTHQPASTGQASTGSAHVSGAPGVPAICQQPASHSLASHVLAIEASPGYLRRRSGIGGRAVGQMGGQSLHTAEATGSKPVTPTAKRSQTPLGQAVCQKIARRSRWAWLTLVGGPL